MALPALDKTGSNLSALSPKRRPCDGCGRHNLKRFAGILMPGESVARCGQYPIGDFARGKFPGYVTLRANGENADLGGIVTCGSVWACAVCAHKIAGVRRREIGKLLLVHKETGGAVYMATLTMPHHVYQSPKLLRQGIAKAFGKILEGEARQREWERAGVIGYVRALEVTHGPNGWHPHLHVLWLFENNNPFAAAAFGKWLFGRWSQTIETLGFGKCSKKAWRFDQVRTLKQAGEYVVKGGEDWELTHAHLKDGRDGHRPPFQILWDFHLYSRASDAALFRQYVLAFKGARQLTWSGGLRKRYDLEVLSDQEVLARTALDMRVFMLISHRGFELVVAMELTPALLEVAAAGNFIAVAAFLAAHGIGMCYLLPPPDG